MVELGDADITLAGLSLWVRGREFPDAQLDWDADWINIRVVVEAQGARVVLIGPWLRSAELDAFTRELVVMRESLTGSAHLDSIEPMLDVEMAFSDSVGHLRATVLITPDHLTQNHRFDFELDQTFLDHLIEQCRRVLEAFPVLGPRPLPPSAPGADHGE